MSAGATPKLTKSARLSSSAPKREVPLSSRAMRPSMPSSRAAKAIAATAHSSLSSTAEANCGQTGAQRKQRDPVITGFAVWMRFRSMDAAGVRGAPFGERSFDNFRGAVEELVDVYEAHPEITFTQTLARNASPGAFGGTDFWASIMMRLASQYGEQGFVERFWRAASSLPIAFTTTFAVTNWVNDVACGVTHSASAVRSPWGFPRPDGSITVRQRQ